MCRGVDVEISEAHRDSRLSLATQTADRRVHCRSWTKEIKHYKAKLNGHSN